MQCKYNVDFVQLMLVIVFKDFILLEKGNCEHVRNFKCPHRWCLTLNFELFTQTSLC